MHLGDERGDDERVPVHVEVIVLVVTGPGMRRAAASVIGIRPRRGLRGRAGRRTGHPTVRSWRLWNGIEGHLRSHGPDVAASEAIAVRRQDEMHRRLRDPELGRQFAGQPTLQAHRPVLSRVGGGHRGMADGRDLVAVAGGDVPSRGPEGRGHFADPVDLRRRWRNQQRDRRVNADRRHEGENHEPDDLGREGRAPSAGAGRHRV